ncbi:unnamed protein product [Trichogramma brassicae]|uniref:Reverse transcriptase domain-containing protein n=1 Tax=Trichogramma brassicae TaxID=86971 RepID=A0A6H5J402_9HYME|nr:unnamed protein product [Trichogramma brassicae]
MLERIICDRLQVFTESPSGLSDQQFGFRRGRSTIDAIEKVVFTAREALRGRRWLGGTKNVNIVGFADDIALVAVAKHLWQVENHLNAAVAQVREALLRLGLATADQKTEVLLLTSRKRMESITIIVGDCYIESAPHTRYLGVHIDARLRFDVHLAKICEKATNVAGALARIMPRIGGPRSSRRKLYANVVDSVLLYGAPIWSSATETQAYWHQAESIHRQACLRINSHLRPSQYTTAGTTRGRANEALPSPPRRCGPRRSRLIPDIKGWVERRHGEMSYHLTQLLTGHGYFKHHSQRYDNNATARCPVCPDATENVEHVFFHCTRFEREREEAQMRLSERIEPENIVRFMLRDLAGWNAVSTLAKSVVTRLRQEAGEHQDLKSEFQAEYHQKKKFNFKTLKI